MVWYHTQQLSDSSSRGCLCSTSVSDTVRGSDGGGSSVGTGPELLPSNVLAGRAGDGLGSGNCVGLSACCVEATNVKITSGVNSGIPVEGGTSVRAVGGVVAPPAATATVAVGGGGKPSSRRG